MKNPSRLYPEDWSALGLATIVLVAVITRGFDAIAFASIVLLTLGFTACSIYSYKNSLKIPVAVSLLLVMLLLWLLLSAFIQPVTYNGMIGIYQFLIGLVFFLVAFNLKGWRLFSIYLIASGVFCGIFTLAQVMLLGELPTGFFRQPNSQAAFFSVLIFLLYTLVADNTHRKNNGMAGIAALFFFYFLLFYIGGRAALLTNLLLSVCALVYVYKSIGHKRTGIIILCILLAGFTGTAGRGWTLTDRLGELVDYIQDYSAMAADDHLLVLTEADGEIEQQSTRVNSLTERVLIWQSAVNMLNDTRWFGSGFASFHMRYPAYRQTEDTSSGQYVHNDYLQLYLELGLPFVFLLLVSAVIVVCHVAAGLKKPSTRLEVMLLSMAAVSLLVHSLVSFNLYVLPLLLLLFAIVGRVVRLSVLQNGMLQQRFLAVDKRGRFRILAGMFLVALPVVSFLAMNIYYEKGKRLYEQDKIARAETYFIRAGQWFDTENIQIARALVTLSAAQALSGQKHATYAQLLDWGLTHLNNAEKLNPWQAEVNYVRALFQREFREQLRQDWRPVLYRECMTALQKNPRHLPARVLFAQQLDESGESARALHILEQGLQNPLPDSPEITAFMRELIRLRQEQGLTAPAADALQQLQRLQQRWQALGRTG